MANINDKDSLSSDEIVKIVKLFDMPKKEYEAQLYAHGIKQWEVNCINYKVQIAN